MKPDPSCMCAAAVILGIGLALAACARSSRSSDSPPPPDLPAIARDVDIDEHLGTRLDPSLRFTDATGRDVALADSFRDGRPVVLTLAYFRCPMLCGLVLRAVARAATDLPFTPGDDFRFVTISFDPNDHPADAASKQTAALRSLGKSAGTGAWSFLVGGPSEIRSLADTLGFRFVYDERTAQYAHPAAAFVLTPDGRISRYLYGTDFSPRDLRLALVEAASGKVGSIVDRILLTCYRFDPATRRFGPFVRGFMRIGGVFILATVSLALALLVRADRRRSARSRGAT